MASKVKVTVSVDAALARELTGIGRRVRRSRSQLVEEALRLWRRRRLEQVLADGYRAMAGDDRATSARYLTAARQALR